MPETGYEKLHWESRWSRTQNKKDQKQLLRWKQTWERMLLCASSHFWFVVTQIGFWRYSIWDVQDVGLLLIAAPCVFPWTTDDFNPGHNSVVIALSRMMAIVECTEICQYILFVHFELSLDILLLPLLFSPFVCLFSSNSVSYTHLTLPTKA